MKSDAAEGAFIFAAVQKQALAHPALSICFIRDGQELLRTPGDGQLHSAIYSVWGRELAGGMLPVHSTWENMQPVSYTHLNPRKREPSEAVSERQNL